MCSEIYTFVDIVQHEYVNISRTVSTRCHVRNVSLVHIVGRSMDAFLFIYVHREERKKRCVEDPTIAGLAGASAQGTLKVATQKPSRAARTPR